MGAAEMNNASPDPERRAAQRMECSDLTGPDAESIPVRAHHLLCAVCVAGGCETAPCGLEALQQLRDAMWEYPFVPLKVIADIELNRAHYLAIHTAGGERELPDDYGNRAADYANRRRDLEVCRRLGIVPGAVMPAYVLYKTLFARLQNITPVCASADTNSQEWPNCPHASAGYYERVACAEYASLQKQARQGESLDGHGEWALFRTRTIEDMRSAKAESAQSVRSAQRLYIRPAHLLCILCTEDIDEPLIEDNLIELRKRMEGNPEIPVTLTEGCCMVCDPCNVYHPGEHVCYHGHIKAQLRDLSVLQRLDLPPGATLPAGELYARIYERIESLRDICAWGDELDTTPFWDSCPNWRSAALDEARRERLISGITE
jgi:hypothetical protein